MKFRLAFMLDLLTPNDIETDFSCKTRGGGGCRYKDKERKGKKRGNMKDADK